MLAKFVWCIAFSRITSPTLLHAIIMVQGHLSSPFISTVIGPCKIVQTGSRNPPPSRPWPQCGVPSRKRPSSPLSCGSLLTSTSLASNDDPPCSAVEKPSCKALLKQPTPVGSVLFPEAQLSTLAKARQFMMSYGRTVQHGNLWAFDRNPSANGLHSGTSQRPPSQWHPSQRHLAAAPRISFAKIPPCTVG